MQQSVSSGEFSVQPFHAESKLVAALTQTVCPLKLHKVQLYLLYEIVKSVKPEKKFNSCFSVYSGPMLSLNWTLIAWIALWALFLSKSNLIC